MADLTTERKIDYFKITATGGDNGLFGHKLIEINEKVSESDRETDYFNSKVNFFLLESKAGDKKIRGIVQQLRQEAPSIREIGHTKSTPVPLKDTEGIDEQTHFIYNPVTSLIAIEYNYHGPKIGLLVNVVNRLYRDHLEPKGERSSYMFIQQGDARKKVSESHEVRSIIARPVDPMTMGEMNEDVDLPAAIKLFKPQENVKVEFKLTARQKGSRLMTGGNFVHDYLPNEQDIRLYDKLEVNAFDEETGKVIPYDLIKDKLQHKATVELTPGTKQIDTNSIVSIIEQRIIEVEQNYLT
jgi:hypothetical protein